MIPVDAVRVKCERREAYEMEWGGRVRKCEVSLPRSWDVRRSWMRFARRRSRLCECRSVQVYALLDDGRRNVAFAGHLASLTDVVSRAAIFASLGIHIDDR